MRIEVRLAGRPAKAPSYPADQGSPVVAKYLRDRDQVGTSPAGVPPLARPLERIQKVSTTHINGVGNDAGVTMRKRSLARTSLSVLAALGITITNPLYASADSRFIDFEAPTYHPGKIYLQDGWAGTGGIAINPLIDEAVVSNTYGYQSFGAQSWRMSNAYTDGAFGTWPFSPSLVDEAGEESAMNGGMSGGERQRHFGVQWDFASTVPGAEQPGLQISASPDRGDGARMSFIRMKDLPTGLSVEFADYRDNPPFGSTTTPADGCSDEDEFLITFVATDLSRAKPHTVKLTMSLIDGPRNDVVKVWVDNKLRHTGTSWEDFFRWCEVTFESRTVDSMLFQARSSGGTAPGTLGNGFLIDNLSYATTSGCHVGKGEGSVGTGSGKAHFKFEKNCADKDATVAADSAGQQFQSTSITESSFDEDSQTLTLVGSGLNDGLPVTFTMTAAEGSDGLPSTFALILSDGFAIQGALLDGFISLE
jgi:hypothetical protein